VIGARDVRRRASLLPCAAIYFFGRLGQGWLGLLIWVMSCIIARAGGGGLLVGGALRK
jgi:hypothetical protein